MVKNINKRKASEYKMQLLIAQNPYSKNPKELFNAIKQMETDVEEVEEEPVFDDVGFEHLKIVMSQNPRFQIKN